MRKTIYIALIIGFLISCGNDKTLSEIEKYVTEIAGGISIYELTDNNGEIYRIIAEIGQPNQSPSNYEFYFKKDSLTFAKIVEFNETGTDTIINSEYYYDGVKLLKQTNWKEEKMDAETVRQVSEFYLVYGKQTTE